MAADATTYLPYYSYSYNVTINFAKSDNILSTDKYINMYSGSTVDYERHPYFNSTTNAVVYDYSMSEPNLIGRDGPKFYIYKPYPIINIQILNDDGQIGGSLQRRCIGAL